MNKSDYISILSKYAYDNGISIYDYYLDLAKRIRLAENSNFEEWEIKCPFLVGDDYTKLLFSKDERMVEYFASAMERVYRLNEPTALVPVNDNKLMVIEEEKKEEKEEENKEEVISRDDIQEVIEATEDDELLSREEIKEVIEEKMDSINDEITEVTDSEFTEDDKVLSREEIKEVIEEKMNAIEEGLSNTDLSDIVNDKFSEIDNDDIINLDDELLSREDIEDVINESYSKLGKLGVFFTSISNKIAKLLNGFAVVKEEEEDTVDLYYHDAEKGELRAKSTFDKETLNVESGYYVNYQEYVNEMLDSIYDQYPTTTKIDFVNEEGVECSLVELLDSVFSTLREAGAIRFGKDLKGKEINSFKELQDINTAGTEKYNGEDLHTGIYVRRDLLNKIFSKYKAKLTLEDVNEEELNNHRSK